MGNNDYDPLSGNNEKTYKPNKRSSDIYIATLNARSLRTSEKLIELVLAINNIKWDIIGISEMARYGEGIEDHNGSYILHYIGETPGLYGVSLKTNWRKSKKSEEPMKKWRAP